MLEPFRRRKFARLTFFTCLQFLISVATFQSFASAESREQIAEDYRAQGYQAQQQENWHEALSFYTKAVSVGLQQANVHNDIGILYEEIGMANKAEVWYLKAIQVDPNYLPPYINLAFLYQKFGHKEKAFTYFKRRYELGEPSDAWTEKAKEELLKIRPEFIHWIRAREAEELNKKLVEEERQEFIERVEKAKSHFERGKQLAEEGKHKEAITEYDFALALTPGVEIILQAKKDATVQVTKEEVKQYSDNAVQLLNAGDYYSAKNEIQKMMSSFQNTSPQSPQ